VGVRERERERERDRAAAAAGPRDATFFFFFGGQVMICRKLHKSSIIQNKNNTMVGTPTKSPHVPAFDIVRQLN
jgi:hypothetical protein